LDRIPLWMILYAGTSSGKNSKGPSVREVFEGIAIDELFSLALKQPVKSIVNKMMESDFIESVDIFG